MPLEKGSSKEAINENIKTEIDAGKDPKQAAAIAYSVAGEDAADSAGVMFTSNGKVLLLQRPDGSWGFPGGSIEEGETPEQAALRETMEETGYVHQKPLTHFGVYDNFSIYVADVDQFNPELNDEHTGAGWFGFAELPTPLFEKNAIVLNDAFTADAQESMRKFDINGWFEVPDNPLSKVGVFNYLGKNIPQEAMKGNGNVMFSVFRPPEELADRDCIASFRLVPWIIDHAMLGDGTNGTKQVEEKGARGVTGEQIWFDPDEDFGTLKGNIKCFSEVLAGQIAGGKTPLSLGYRCVYQYAPGSFNGIPYTYVQRRIRGNHLASVDDGRMGPEVAVMDGFSFTVDSKEFIAMATKKTTPKKTAVAVLRQRLQAFAMDADEAVKDGKDEGGEMKQAVEAINAAVPLLEAIESLQCVGESEDIGTMAGDTMQSPGDERTKGANGLDEDDADTDKPKKGDEGEPGKAMDAAEVGKMIERAVANALAGRGMDATEVVHTIASRDKLASQLSEFVGAFDHSEMTAQQVAEYGVKQLEMSVRKGGEIEALQAFMHKRPSPRSLPTAFAGDAKDRANKPSFVSAQIAERS